MKTRFLQWRSGGADKLSMTIAGDFCPREENCSDLVDRVSEITEAVKPFFADSDIKMIQWECTVTRQDTPIDKSGPNHRCYPECAVFARILEADTVLLANNHTGDYGDPGVKDSLDTFAKLNIRTVGAGMNEAEASRPLRFTQNGISVSIINAAEYEFGIARGNKAGSYGFEPLKLAARVRAEKTVSDLVVVALHGGHEHFPFPTPRLRQLCRSMADSGADVVFNCHSHCPLGYEIYNNVPIVYSPGNFYFPNRPTSLPCWYIGYLPKFFMDADGAYAMEILPYFNYKQALTLMDEEDSGRFFAYLDELSAPIADEAKLQKLFDAWCVRGKLDGYIGQMFERPRPESLNTRDEVKANLPLRNLLTCQSHHDLLRNTLILMENYELGSAGEMIPAIEAAQNPSWVKIVK